MLFSILPQTMVVEAMGTYTRQLVPHRTINLYFTNKDREQVKAILGRMLTEW